MKSNEGSMFRLLLCPLVLGQRASRPPVSRIMGRIPGKAMVSDCSLKRWIRNEAISGQALNLRSLNPEPLGAWEYLSIHQTRVLACWSGHTESPTVSETQKSPSQGLVSPKAGYMEAHRSGSAPSWQKVREFEHIFTPSRSNNRMFGLRWSCSISCPNNRMLCLRCC